MSARVIRRTDSLSLSLSLFLVIPRRRSKKGGETKLRWLPKASPFGWMKFLRNTTYDVGGSVYSALDVEHSILRSTRPFDDNVFIGRLLPYFKGNDPRMKCKVRDKTHVTSRL